MEATVKPWRQTETPVQGRASELAQRQEAERLCMRSELRLYLLMVCLSQGLTVLFAGTGAAVNWLFPLCLLPGAALYALGLGLRRRWGAPTLTETMRAAGGRGLAGLWQLYLLGLLLWQGAAVLTEAVCLMTEGVVTNASPFWIGGLTLLTALCCARQVGLPRCVWLLRVPLLLLLLLLVADLGRLGRLDHLLPISGGGDAANLRLLRLGCAMSWPLLLFGELPPAQAGCRRGTGALPPLLLAGGTLLGVSLALPTELALTAVNLADTMLLPLVFLTPLNRVLAVTGWLIGLILTLAVSLEKGAAMGAGLLPGHRSGWVLGGLAALLLGLQLISPHALRGVLKAAQPWLLLPGIVLLASALLLGMVRKRRGRA